MQDDRIADGAGCRSAVRCDLRFSVNNGHFCEPAPSNHDFMRRTKIPAHGILDSHISEAKTITTRLRLNVLRPVLGVANV
jgi:hypothetical protein